MRPEAKSVYSAISNEIDIPKTGRLITERIPPLKQGGREPKALSGAPGF